MSQQAVIPGAARRVLRRTADGKHWYVPLGVDSAWVAVPRVEVGGGGGWFRSDATLDPASSGWTPVSCGEVLAYLEDGRDQAAELTAAMVGHCMADGLGLEALELADSLLDHGYELEVSLHAQRARATTTRIH